MWVILGLAALIVLESIWVHGRPRNTPVAPVETVTVNAGGADLKDMDISALKQTLASLDEGRRLVLKALMEKTKAELKRHAGRRSGGSNVRSMPNDAD